MSDAQRLMICTECDWHGQRCDVEMVQDPKEGWGWHQWHVCPLCREADHITDACDEPGCTKRATCGWPEKGWPDAPYRRTCGDHMRRDT